MALQLERIGINYRIFEARNEDEMEQGVFLGITPNGLNVLRELIDISQLKEEFTLGKMTFYSANVKPIGVLDTNYQMMKYGVEPIQVKRAKISKELLKSVCEKSISVHYGKRLVEIMENENGVKVRFDDGLQVEGDFLLACDGFFSSPSVHKIAGTKTQ